MRTISRLLAVFGLASVALGGPACLAADQAGEQLVPPSNRATELRVQAEILAKSGDFITADEMFVRSIEFAHADADPQAWDWSLLFIATAQARAGSIYAGLETAGTIQTEAYQVWALRDIAPMQAASGDVDGALGTAASIPEEDARAHALGGIAIARARVGDLDRAAVIAGGITEPGIRARAYTAITRARVLSGR